MNTASHGDCAVSIGVAGDYKPDPGRDNRRPDSIERQNTGDGARGPRREMRGFYWAQETTTGADGGEGAE
jgi:hypothetical protein